MLLKSTNNYQISFKCQRERQKKEIDNGYLEVN